MDDLGKEYSLLFNGITDALKELERISNRLKYLQQLAEESFLTQGEEEDEQAGEGLCTSEGGRRTPGEGPSGMPSGDGSVPKKNPEQ